MLAGVCITVFGGLFTASLYMPHLWIVVLFQFLAQAAVAPLAICIFQTLAATAPPEMRAICFGLFGVYALVFGGFAGGVLLGAISDATNVTTALTLIGPVCAIGGVLLLVGSRFVRHDITLVIEDVLERYAEGKRRKSGGAIPALQVHNMDFYLRHPAGALRRQPRGGRRRDRGPARHQRRRQEHAPAGGSRVSTIPIVASSASSAPTAPTSSPSRSSTATPRSSSAAR